VELTWRVRGAFTGADNRDGGRTGRRVGGGSHAAEDAHVAFQLVHLDGSSSTVGKGGETGGKEGIGVC